MDYIAMWHACGSAPCNRIAFWYRSDQFEGVIRSQHALTVEGQKPASYSEIKCGGCGHHVGPRALSKSHAKA